MESSTSDESDIRRLIEDWAAAVRAKNLAGILADHSPDIVMFDVPPPFQSRGIEAYRKTWDAFFKWVQDSGEFNIEEMNISTSQDVAFVTALMRCAGTEPTNCPGSKSKRNTSSTGRRQGDARRFILR